MLESIPALAGHPGRKSDEPPAAGRGPRGAARGYPRNFSGTKVTLGRLPKGLSSTIKWQP